LGTIAGLWAGWLLGKVKSSPLSWYLEPITIRLKDLRLTQTFPWTNLLLLKLAGLWPEKFCGETPCQKKKKKTTSGKRDLCTYSPQSQSVLSICKSPLPSQGTTSNVRLLGEPMYAVGNSPSLLTLLLSNALISFLSTSFLPWERIISSLWKGFQSQMMLQWGFHLLLPDPPMPLSPLDQASIQVYSTIQLDLTMPQRTGP
jgi:hypothetical protein